MISLSATKSLAAVCERGLRNLLDRGIGADTDNKRNHNVCDVLVFEQFFSLEMFTLICIKCTRRHMLGNTRVPRPDDLRTGPRSMTANKTLITSVDFAT